MQAQHIEQVVQKLQALAPSRINEVEDFIDLMMETAQHRLSSIVAAR